MNSLLSGSLDSRSGNSGGSKGFASLPPVLGSLRRGKRLANPPSQGDDTNSAKLNLRTFAHFAILFLTLFALDANGNPAQQKRIQTDDIRGLLLQETAHNRTQQSLGA